MALSLIGYGLGLGGIAALRRLSRRSGVTDAEHFGALPGDDLVPHPMVEWTRATTIGAPPEGVWPWLVQMGYGRGGWYTNERLDRIVWRVESRNADRILPEWQQLSEGDVVPDGPDYAAYFHVVQMVEKEAIVYYSIRHPYRGHPIDPTDRADLRRLEEKLVEGGTYIDFSWAFVLRPVGPNTRLIIRARANIEPRRVHYVQAFFGLIDLFHVTTMFRGIRRRVERR